MQIKVYWILHGIPHKEYILDYEGTSVTIEQVENLLRQAKRKFNMPGKQYIFMAGDKVFYAVYTVVKDEDTGVRSKKWLIYELSGASEA